MKKNSFFNFTRLTYLLQAFHFKTILFVELLTQICDLKIDEELKYFIVTLKYRTILLTF